MYQAILTQRENPVVTPAQLASFGRFDVPTGQDLLTAELFIQAATDQVEVMAAQACLYEQCLLTLDFFPNTQDPRNFMQYELSYAFAITPWWWWGFPTKDSIELVRRPVIVPTNGETASVTALNVANNQVTVSLSGSPFPEIVAGDVIVLSGTAEGNVNNPSSTPSTTPFLNGVPLVVSSVNGNQFTAPFNNLYTIQNQGQVVAGSYTNNSDTGTATLITNPLLLTYYDQNGVLQTWNTTNYTVQYDKICLNVGNWWPLTDRRQDCIQINYWAGYDPTNSANVPSQLQMAVLYLANHMWNIRDYIAVETTSEIKSTLCLMLSSFRSFRIPR
jgi:hypothetical protein